MSWYFKRACIIHKVADIKLDEVQFSIMVCLRNIFKIDPIKTGVYSLRLVDRVNLKEIENNFWHLVEATSISLHRRLENNEIFDKFDYLLNLIKKLI